MQRNDFLVLGLHSGEQDHVADGAGLDSLLVAQRVVKEGALGVFALDQHTSRLLAAEADGVVNDIQRVGWRGKETGEE